MKNRLISRNHNNISVKNGFIQKTSTNSQKLNSEYLWLKAMQKNIFIPSVNQLENGYEIRYIKSSNLGEVFWKLSFNEKKSLINIYVDFIVSNKKTISNFLTLNKELLIDKFIERTSKLEISEKLKDMYCEKMVTLIPKIDQCSFGVMHGDLFFGNTLYGNNQLYFIDPRGYDSKNEIYGSVYYDVIKLAHSVHGLYDNIIFNESKIKHYKKINKYFFKIAKEVLGFSRDEILLGEMGLFLSMIPLHSDSEERQAKFKKTALRIAKEISWEKL